MHFETRAVHSGAEPESATGAIAPPIHLSTTFQRGPEGDTPLGFSYIRDGNPTQSRLEEALAAIDGAEAALVFASGMAAATAIFLSLPAGSHVVLPIDGYYGLLKLGHSYLPKWQIDADFVEMDDPDVVRARMRENTRLVWCETPSNPLLHVVDISAIAGVARERGALAVVDGTFASPALQRPIELGADVVLHSTTKYLGGHSDVQGGSLAFRRNDSFVADVAQTRKIAGGVGSPFNSWLVLRGIRSLGARMRMHCENARAVARFLERHPRVERVNYPGLESHPGHEIARRQMSDFGGMMSFLVRGTRADTLAIAARTQVFVRATSLGGTESLIEHRQSSEGEGSLTPPNLLRLSVGLEHSDDLIADLEQALG